MGGERRPAQRDGEDRVTLRISLLCMIFLIATGKREKLGRRKDPISNIYQECS
jgi:hypothetical protein